MPGPGPHLMYAMGSGLCLTSISNGRFSPHHTLIYTINAFFGPDLGSFSEWFGSLFGGQAHALGSALEHIIHHPFFYILLLGLPLSFLYSRISSYLLHTQLLDSVSKVPLTRKQCFLLISAASFTHFFLDHLFEENGKTTTYTWILSTGWWQSRAPVNPDAVVVVVFLCACLIGGFFYLNRASASISIKNKSYQSMLLVMSIASLYCFWCAIQIYWISPHRPAVGEEADLGVLVFLTIYFFLPYVAEGSWNLAATNKYNHSIEICESIQIYWNNPRRSAVGEGADLGILVFLAVYFFPSYGLCMIL